MTAGTIAHIEGLAAAAVPWLVCAIGALLVAWSVLLCRQNGAQNGPEVLLGYNYSSPGDTGGAPARIVQSWISNRSSLGDADAWMKANADNNAWNACAIVKGDKYVYFKKNSKRFLD